MTKNEFLVECSVCKKIKLDDEKEIWISRNENPILYDSLQDTYKENISHGYCPKDSEQFNKEIDKYFEKH